MADQTAAREFTPLLWHDNPLHGIRLEIGDLEAGDWRSEFGLDIDHIITWACGTAGRGTEFRIAPATLTFHHASDLWIALDCGDTGGQVALHELSINQITREQVREQKVCLDRAYYRSRIEFNWPRGGVIGLVPAASPKCCVLSRSCQLPRDCPPHAGRDGMGASATTLCAGPMDDAEQQGKFRCMAVRESADAADGPLL